jgi:hypothetical protein
MDASIIFPVFRKLHAREVYYCITSASQFIELSQLGKYYTEVEINAVQYPEKVRIHEMIEGNAPFEVITETAYQKVKTEWDNMFFRR